MKINEVINEKKRVDEVLPLVPLAIAGGKALAGAMGAGKAGVAAHAAKVAAKKFGAPALNKGRQWLTKAPPDSSVPDAMKNKDMVPGPQAYHKKAVAGAGVKKPKPQGKLSPAAGAAIAQAQQVKR
tara:strand:- start:4808 stop:5185 length:378 start_codon:yes stop_codon:yes gene_type:complete